MMKFAAITPNEDGLSQEKLHDVIPKEDKYYKVSPAYVDLCRVESLDFCTTFKGEDCCNVYMFSGDRFTIVANMDKLAVMVIKAKANIIFKGYNN